MQLTAFNQLLTPYREPMLRFAWSLIRNKEEAEDLVQDVYLKLWVKRSALSKVDNLEAYVMRAVKNETLNRLKRPLLNSTESEDGVLETNPQHLLEAADAEEILLRLIAQLPPVQKTVFQLRTFGHFEATQIASMLETDLNNIRVNLSIARKKLKKAFQEYMRDEKERLRSTS